MLNWSIWNSTVNVQTSKINSCSIKPFLVTSLKTMRVLKRVIILFFTCFNVQHGSLIAILMGAEIIWQDVNQRRNDHAETRNESNRWPTKKSFSSIEMKWRSFTRKTFSHSSCRRRLAIINFGALRPQHQFQLTLLFHLWSMLGDVIALRKREWMKL